MIDLGTERVERLLNVLGKPQNNYKCVHVTGTNGKGSVCAIVSSVLVAAGICCGRFSSPHLISQTDSIAVDGIPISESEFKCLSRNIADVNNAHNINASPFELLTCLALSYFESRKVKVAVVEVGMGGKRDATNVFSNPTVCVFTPISMDHTEFLGDTIEAIALEKSGIMKRGAFCVIGRQPFTSADNVIRSQAALVGGQVLAVNQITELATDPSLAFRHVEYSFNGNIHQSRFYMLGDYQCDNLSTALAALEGLTRACPQLEITKQAVDIGVSRSRWKGRLEFVEVRGSQVLVDGAHNEAGAHALRSFVDSRLRPRRPDGCVNWIVGFKEGKPLAPILDCLLRPGDKVVAVSFSKPEGMPWISPMPPSRIVDFVSTHFESVDARSGTDVSAVITSASETWSVSDNIVLCGSLYVISDFYRVNL